jgi:hypothetical protein
MYTPCIYIPATSNSKPTESGGGKVASIALYILRSKRNTRAGVLARQKCLNAVENVSSSPSWYSDPGMHYAGHYQPIQQFNTVQMSTPHSRNISPWIFCRQLQKCNTRYLLSESKERGMCALLPPHRVHIRPIVGNSTYLTASSGRESLDWSSRRDLQDRIS